jgi:hypothetical protein
VRQDRRRISRGADSGGRIAFVRRVSDVNVAVAFKA